MGYLYMYIWAKEKFKKKRKKKKYLFLVIFVTSTPEFSNPLPFSRIKEVLLLGRNSCDQASFIKQKHTLHHEGKHGMLTQILYIYIYGLRIKTTSAPWPLSVFFATLRGRENRYYTLISAQSWYSATSPRE